MAKATGDEYTLESGSARVEAYIGPVSIAAADDAKLLSAVADMARIIEVDELMRRIEALEKRSGRKK